MASDEQRSPWFPVQPEGQPVEDAPTPADATEVPVPAPVQTPTPATAMPSFDDIVAPTPTPSSGETDGDRPFELTPSRPSVTRPVTASIPHVVPQDALPGEADPLTPLTPLTEVAPTSTPEPPSTQQPLLSPYLSAERPTAPRASYEPPDAETFRPTAPGPTPPADVFEPPAAPVTSATPYVEPFATPASQYTRSPFAPAPDVDSDAGVDANASADDAWLPDRRAGAPATNPVAAEPAAPPPPVVSPAVEQASPSEAEAPRLDSAPSIPFAPWTGAIPQVQYSTPAPPVLAEPEPTPVLAEPEPTFAPAEPEPTPVPVPVPGILSETPLVDEADAADAPFLVGGLVPMPIEAEDGEIVAPVLPPDAAEIQPRGADPMHEYSSASPLDAPAPAQDSPHDFVPDAADPVRQLGASALSTASLEAAGAPTPRGGVPLIGAEQDGVPSFGEEEPFVPRFEPFGGVVPATVPTVSFTTPAPAPTSPSVSPLSDLAVPESDEPAYIPKEQFVEAELASAGLGDEEADVPTTNPFAPPARPWSTVDPAEVEFVGGEALAVEVGAFGAELPGPLEAPEDAEAPEVFAPAAPSWEGIIGGTTEPTPVPASYEAPVAVTPGQFPPVTDQEAAPAEASAGEFDTVSAENDFTPELDEPASEPAAGSDETDALAPFSSDDAPGVDGDALLESDAHPVVDVPAAPPALPMTPAASFFAATAARNARRADDLENPLPALLPNDEEPDESSTEEAAPAEASASVDAPTDVFVLEPPAPDTLRAEPVRTTATAYTPSTGEWARPAFAASDAVTEVNGMERIGDTTEMGAPAAQSAANAETGGPSAVEVTTRKTHRRRRLVLWIVLAAVIAAGAGVLAYRLFFLPEPITLPVPTTTAPAPTPTAEPMEITDPSDFVAAMPTTVGTNVLVSYEVKSTVGDTTLPARTAEQVTLTYGQGSSSQVFTVDAYQHYNEDDAKTTYDAFAAGATDVEDVTVNGTTVGQRAYSTTGSTGTLVWRNGTAVFSLAGPSDEVLDFYEHFGI